MDKKKLARKKAYVPVDKELLKNKNYHATARATFDTYAIQSFDGDSSLKIVSKAAIKKVLRSGFNMQTPKINKVIATYLDAGVLQEYDGDSDYYSMPFMTPFLPIPSNVIQFFLERPDRNFKVYCILLLLYRLHADKGYSKPATFCVSGKNGLIGKCGYSDSNRNKEIFRDILEDLQDNGLIEISAPKPQTDLFGKNCGWYRNLYKVNDTVMASDNPNDKITDEELLYKLMESLGPAFSPTKKQKKIIRGNPELCDMFFERCV